MELANHSNCKLWPGKPYEESKALSPYCSFLGQLEHLNPIRLSFQKKKKKKKKPYAYKDNKFQMLSFLKGIFVSNHMFLIYNKTA